jgi:hypothetical protein
MALIMMRNGNIRFANVGDKMHAGERQIFYRGLENGERLEKLGEIQKEEGKVKEHETF